MFSALKRLEAAPRWLTLSLGALLLAGAAAVDRASAPEFSMALLYLLPVMLTAWYGGRAAGLLFAVVAAGAWLANEQAAGMPATAAAAWWNALAWLTTFVLVALLASALHTRLVEGLRRAATDPLTGLLNDGAFRGLTQRELERARRYGHPFSLAYLDVDRLASVNDAYGRTAGDVVLRRVADVLKAQTRDTDVAGRLGEDTFAVLFVETRDGAAATAVDHLQARLAHSMSEIRTPLTVSAAVVAFEGIPQDADEMLAHASGVIAEAKAAGPGGVRYAEWYGPAA